MSAADIFVSYSSKDENLVVPIVSMLRTTDSRVFFAPDSIPPGKKWEDVIGTAIDGCRKVMLFWCSHAARSKEVKKEYERGILKGKDICPVLLDDVTLPRPLSDYQAIKMGDGLGAHEETHKKLMRRDQLRRNSGLGDGGGGHEAETLEQGADGSVYKVWTTVRQPPASALRSAARRLDLWLDERL